MTPADEMGFDNQFEEQLRAVVKEATLQPRLVEDLHGSEDVQTLLLRHLNQETSERRAIYFRLQSIESALKRRRSRGIVRYLVAMGIGVVATLAWQSYGETTKQIIATKAPELGWSPEAKQMVNSWVQQLGWTKPPATHMGRLQRQNACTNRRQFGAIRNEPGNLRLRKTAWWGWEDSNFQPNDYQLLASEVPEVAGLPV